MQKKYRNDISTKKVVAENILSDYQHPYTVDWSKYRSGVGEENVDTSVPIDKIQQLWSELEKLPEGFALHPRVESIMADRRKMASGALPINWGFAEIMAYATLIDEGYAVRLSGQDSGRGTFFHRHAILHDQVNGDDYIPLKYNLVADSSRFQIIDSLLSEEAVLGFELGYATAEPQALVIWEAQFGDFANGAQVFIDQFISSAQSKWDRLTGLTLFLPHGFEGQGPEHSSARLERYLQLCAESNMTVCVPTTAAQIFHLLRAQMLHCYRHPLIVMSPKSMLRNPLAASALNELEQGGFMPLIPDQAELDSSKVRRVILCTGKVYYDLYNARRDRGIDNIAIVRVEQLYPFPRQLLVDLLDKFDDADSIIWCQEEPMNQGAWYQVRHHLEACTGEQHRLTYVGREPSAAPATGSYTLHLKQLHGFIDEALSLEEDGNMEHKTVFTRET
jgi:2-oxoglutarate dehydrogenase E1 component